MIVHVILCLNEREIQKKKRKKINQEDQISKLTFNFPSSTFNLNFSQNGFTLFTKKRKKKQEKENKRKEKKRT